MFGFYRLAAASPVLRVADVQFNLQRMEELYRQAAEKNCALVLFPELSLTSRSCGDLFFQRRLLQMVAEAAEEFASSTGESVAVFSIPAAIGDRVRRCRVVAQNGRIAGMSADGVLMPGGRWCSGGDAEVAPKWHGHIVLPSSTLFDCGFVFGIESGESLRRPMSDGIALAAAGARALLIPAAEAELPGTAGWRRAQLSERSLTLASAQVFAGAGVGESTENSVCSGALLIADGGRISAENRLFQRGDQLIFADVDFERIDFRRRQSAGFSGMDGGEGRLVLDPAPEAPDFEYAFNPAAPFVPGTPEARVEVARTTLEIQSAALAKRVEHTRAAQLVLGVSGGLDSTLALLVCRRVCELLSQPMQRILAVTMPGFGTTGRTRNNAVRLAELIGAQVREIDITAACRRHFADIGHDPEQIDAVFENTQARERTQILMDIANGCGGLVVGTGDLSELALGWCTFNGDQMAMYSVNASVPKTLIPVILEAEAVRLGGEAAGILRDVIATPVSPELVPPSANGSSGHETEKLLGPYELHDFFLFHTLTGGAEPEKVLALAEAAFAGAYSPAEISRCLELFLRRFFSQQFKRGASPDAPMTGAITFSPNVGFRMPADAVGWGI